MAYLYTKDKQRHELLRDWKPRMCWFIDNWKYYLKISCMSWFILVETPNRHGLLKCAQWRSARCPWRITYREVSEGGNPVSASILQISHPHDHSHTVEYKERIMAQLLSSFDLRTEPESTELASQVQREFGTFHSTISHNNSTIARASTHALIEIMKTLRKKIAPPAASATATHTLTTVSSTPSTVTTRTHANTSRNKIAMSTVSAAAALTAISASSEHTTAASTSQANRSRNEITMCTASAAAALAQISTSSARSTAASTGWDDVSRKKTAPSPASAAVVLTQIPTSSLPNTATLSARPKASHKANTSTSSATVTLDPTSGSFASSTPTTAASTPDSTAKQLKLHAKRRAKRLRFHEWEQGTERL